MGGCKRVVSSFQMTKKEGELEEEGREGDEEGTMTAKGDRIEQLPNNG